MKHTIFLIALIIAFTSALSLIFGENKANVAVPKVQQPFVFRANLSSYGFFKGDIKQLEPAIQTFPYKLNTPLFTDYTIKNRFIHLPKGSILKYINEGLLDFPDSTILIKNFAYLNAQHQKVMIETRLLVKDPFDKKWKVMNYLWNKEQTEAYKHIVGAKLSISLLDEQDNQITTNYQVPNTNDCKRCHINNNVIIPIGPKARNLNTNTKTEPINQLSQWIKQGILTNISNIDKLEQLPNWADSENYSVTQRARAYLDVNCAHCHTKGGDAFNTGLFLNYEEDNLLKLGIKKEPVSAGGGAGGLNFDIIPGHSKESILFYRLNSNLPGEAMPELGRTIVHKEGVQLIRDWINQLPQE